MILTVEFYNGDRESLVEIEVRVGGFVELGEQVITGFDVLSVTETLSDGEVIDLDRTVPRWISYDDIITEIEFSDWGE